MDKGQRIYMYNGDGQEPLLLLWVLWIYVRILVQNLPTLFVRDTYATQTMIVNHLKCPKPFFAQLTIILCDMMPRNNVKQHKFAVSFPYFPIIL